MSGIFLGNTGRVPLLGFIVNCVSDKFRFYCVNVHEIRCLEIRKPEGVVLLRDVGSVRKLEVDLGEYFFEYLGV